MRLHADLWSPVHTAAGGWSGEMPSGPGVAGEAALALKRPGLWADAHRGAVATWKHTR